MQLRASEKTGFFKPGELSSYDPSAIGICVSGGGYRASLFHAGAFLRMNELGLLGRAARIASVSGGSITTGVLAMNWDKIDWGADQQASHDDMIAHLVKPVDKACDTSIDVGIGIAGFLPGISAGNALARSYDRNIFDGLRINKITDKVRFIFCAANLQTGGLTRFTRDYVADWQAFRSTTHNIRLSEAVASSSAFPPVLSPVRLSLDGETVTFPEGGTLNDPDLRKTPILVDGGVYDNLGLEPIWKRCGVIIGSNAGGNNAPKSGRFLTGHMVRVVMSMLDVTVNWRERMLVNLYTHALEDGIAERIGAYWTIATDHQNYQSTDGGLTDTWTGAKPDKALLDKARDLPTRLRAFSKSERRAAMLAGYAHADASIRRHLLPDAPAPTDAPVLP
jgi:NTE family protein